MPIVDFLRHGEPVGGRMYRGQTDHPLSSLGWEQMQRSTVRNPGWCHVVSSPLSRCLDFARDLSRRHELPLDVEDELKEIHFGCWEGMTAEQVMQRYPGRLQEFWADPRRNPPAQGESLEDFQNRVHRVLERLVSRFHDQHILVVAHAGVIRMVLNQILEYPLQHVFRVHVPYACVTRVRYYEQDHFRSPELCFHAGVIA